MIKNIKEEEVYCLCGFIDEDKNDNSEIVHDYYLNIKTISSGGKYWSISAPSSSIEELYEKNKIPKEPCKLCGNIYSNHYSHKDLSILGLCFSCDLWEERAKIAHSKIVVDHVLYSNGGRKSRNESSFLGHGGHEFKIQMDSGEIIETNNLWCGGDVPKRFWDKIPNNAKFI